MSRHVWRGFVLAALLAPASASWALQDSSRGQSWEAAFRIINVQGDTYEGNNGAKAETDSDVGWGFGFGFNVDENLSFAGNFNWADLDYQGTGISGINGSTFDADGELEISTLNFNATYNILRKSFTPFVSAGIGATYIDTNIPNGLAYPVCWWDPWYGYYCGTAVPTKDETDFSYNIGAGLRWDVVDNFFIKASANRLWIDASGNIGHPSFISYAVDFGFRFQ
ncbi:MAG: outer membrane beta-barrel protein [Pedobacter sp.]|nr:outer membrane beta-barrel protein [Pedobacter sp.]